MSEPVPPPVEPTPTGPLRLEVVAEDERAASMTDLRAALVSNPVVRNRYPDADLWVVKFDMLGKDEDAEAEPWFRAALADMTGSDVVDAEGSLWDFASVVVMPTGRQRLPNDEEHAWALEVLRSDPELARRMDAGEVEAYRPLPPLASYQEANGTVVRAVTVGLRETGPDGTARHRLVAVSSADGEVSEIETADGDCGLPHKRGGSHGTAAVGGAGDPGADGARQARVQVWQGDELLWEFLLVRPSASSGVNGSGVELRRVEYRGVRVLHRAHVPIVNVAFDDGEAARLWLDEESGFDAEGEEPVAGFRVCASAPATVVERGDGGGAFRGVALWLDGDDLAIVSQLEAGWYRYVSEWRLEANGTIRPRLAVTSLSNPRTCRAHTHHAYWRLDFDVVGAEDNRVQEFNHPTLEGQLAPWQTVRYEVKRRRDPAHERQWRVRAIRSAHGYAIVPGAHDGTADDFGAGDVWILAYHDDELDDGEGFTTDPARARAQLDRFVTRELVERDDLVVWYGVHLRHGDGTGDGTADGIGDGIGDGIVRVGPDLEPFSWKPRREPEAYAPLVPPKPPQPDDE